MSDLQNVWDKIIRFNDEYVPDWRNVNLLQPVDLIDDRNKAMRETILQIVRGDPVTQGKIAGDATLILVYLISLLEMTNIHYNDFKTIFENKLYNLTGQLEKTMKKQADSSFNPLEYYNMRFSLGYVDDHIEHLHHAEWIADRFNPKTLLDIGCAKGFMIRNLVALKPETRYVGLDISSVALRQRVFSGDAVVGCGWALPFRDKSFELLHSGGVLEHFPVEYVDDAIREFSRVAEKNVHYLALNSGDEPVKSESREHTTIAKRRWWVDKIGENRNWLIGAIEDKDDCDLGFGSKTNCGTWTRVNWEGKEFDGYFKK